MSRAGKKRKSPSTRTAPLEVNTPDYLRTVVRVFPDYAGTILWFVGGPVEYRDAALTESLAADMQAWERAYYEGLDDEMRWKGSAESETRHTEEGLRLAYRLSDELGDAFEVEVSAGDTHSREHLMRIRGHGPGSNPLAIANFRRWAAEDEAEDAELAASKLDGSFLSWGSYEPLSRTGHDSANGVDGSDPRP